MRWKLTLLIGFALVNTTPFQASAQNTNPQQPAAQPQPTAQQMTPQQMAAQRMAKKPAQKAAPKIDPKADEQMKKMSEYISKAQSFSFTTTSSTDVVTKQGEILTFIAQSKTDVQRPNMMRSERVGEASDLTFFYDGKEVVLYGKGVNYFAKAAAPNHLDRAIDFTRQKLGIEAPGADFLFSDPYRALMEDVMSGMYISKTKIGDKDAHHLAFRSRLVDWQIWIADGPQPMPLKFLIVSKDTKHSPQFSLDFKEFNTAATFPPNHFTFVPPEGAQRIVFSGRHLTPESQQARRQ